MADPPFFLSIVHAGAKSKKKTTPQGGFSSVCQNLVEFRREAAKKSSIRFSERRVRDEKHFSARKRASAASALQRAAKNSKKAMSLFGKDKKTTPQGGFSFTQR